MTKFQYLCDELVEKLLPFSFTTPIKGLNTISIGDGQDYQLQKGILPHSKIFFYHILILCVCIGMCACTHMWSYHSMNVGVIGQIAESVLSFYVGSGTWDSGCKAWQQMSLPAEPPECGICEKPFASSRYTGESVIRLSTHQVSSCLQEQNLDFRFFLTY